MSAFEIAQLWIYPVKSLGGMAVERVQVTAAGSFHGDREWIVTRPDGKMLWQGDVPAMTLLSARIEHDCLVLEGPEPADRIIVAPTEGAPADVLQYGYRLAGHDQGEAAASWLSERLSTPCRLVRVGQAAHDWGGLNPLHAISMISLASLNARLGMLQPPIEPERFRPNIVLSGDHQPFEEERIGALDLGAARLLLREPCTRCELPNISRADATRSRQPLKLIGAMSKERGSTRPAAFGIYSRAEGLDLRFGQVSHI
ncbi:MOSC domain-containing protein [Devosia sediminis]|uniref:MOSC N-terminal beta barrel domain-containing protein n=1 Tax=Devosia sediminis TaxID=2798801 RepID=A0A934J167_9HYPH|nr:MOSC N-terminal beta barrel domain-containing protein [Devosia sediminis]MBJ3786925.1 MOSC N-terminal beta barrel domain-containing protein [Devosia sediminis]